MVSRQKPQPEVRMVAESITRYLESRPQAVDSIEGIVHWWLLRQRIEDSTEVVQAAIDSLVAEGVVKAIESNGKTLYTSNRQPEADDADDKLT
jgi:predicted sugar kinase